MRAGIALGSNLGDRLLFLQTAFQRIRRQHRPPAPLYVSSIYETTPLDCPGSDGFYLNAVVEIEDDTTPEKLWSVLQDFEQQLGRSRPSVTNAPRTIDLDLLYYGAVQMQESHLTIPHPRLSRRRFVLEPIAEFAPELILPGLHQTVRQLLAELPPQGRVERIALSLIDHAENHP